MSTPVVRVMFVCLGNICRSPMAEAIFRHQVQAAGLSDQVHVASSGTGTWHIGEPPHAGTQAILAQHGIDWGTKVAQAFTVDDLRTYDYVLVADASNMETVRARADNTPTDNLHYILDFAPDTPGRDVPDPYYTGDFAAVYAMLARASAGLLQHIQHGQHGQHAKGRAG